MANNSSHGTEPVRDWLKALELRHTFGASKFFHPREFGDGVHVTATGTRSCNTSPGLTKEDFQSSS